MDPLLESVKTLGAIDPTANMPDEIKALLAELPNWIKQRKEAIDNTRRAYDEHPGMQETPFQASLRGRFGSGLTDSGAMVAAGNAAERERADFIRDSKIAREKAVLEGLDLNAFDKMYQNVAKNMTTNKDQIHGSSDTGFYSINPVTGKQKLVIPGVIQQRQKDRLRNIILTERLKQGGDDKQASEYADKVAHDIIFKYSPEEVEDYIVRNGNAATLITDQKLPPVTTTPDESSTAALHLKEIDAQLKKYGNDPKYAVPVAQLMEDKQRLTAMLAGKPMSPAYEGTPRQEASLNKLATITGIPNAPGVKPVTPVMPPLKTPGQLKYDDTTKANWANEIPKLAESIKANEAKLTHFAPMESMLLSGNLPSGPLHEYKNVIGSLASTYDPKGYLAEKYGNNAPAYFGELMNLVRADIKALGAGTAVSNLDLIVSQMAAGDLRNSPQGNLRLIGLQKYVAAEKAKYDKKYVDYIKKNQEGEGFITGEKLPPEYALRRKVNSKGLESYELYSRSQYEKEFAKRFDGKKPSIDQWKDYSKRSIEMMFSGEDYAKR